MTTGSPQPALDEYFESIAAHKLSRALDDKALHTIFVGARTANGFINQPVPRNLLERVVELTLLGPTSANGLPLRLVFIESEEGKQKLLPCLSPGNVEKTMSAPVTAIAASDSLFYEHFPRLFPHRGSEMKERWATSPPVQRQQAASDNALLQMGYLIVAARAVGLDAGPLAGFDRAMVDAEFFPDGRLATQYLINLGFAEDTKTLERLPRFDVDEIVRFV